MDIRKPKLIHNWREFFKEVGTIVLGVSIALAAEQGVEWWHWRNQVAQAKEMIATELAANINNAVVKLGTHHCAERRLAELSEILDTASANGRLPPLGPIGITYRGRWLSGTWDNVVASQVGTHFPRQYLMDLAGIYQLGARMTYLSSTELDIWSDIATMIGPGRRLDASSEADLRKALSRAAVYESGIVNQARILLASTKALQLPFSQKDLAAMAAIRRDMLDGKGLAGSIICEPMGAPPPHYGRSTVRTFTREETMQIIADSGRGK